ncbi:MAG: hypothetical protein A4E62_01284 [Syntrophorhabdus sp. PtaU1.Bin002]|nr:MAG: hypothetical protein A4E62_01284 [Syntrophorhabdus sp. PtaU1.Bin002]
MFVACETFIYGYRVDSVGNILIGLAGNKVSEKCRDSTAGSDSPGNDVLDNWSWFRQLLKEGRS